MVTNHLYRSRTDCMIAGVCGGLGEYFGFDPTIVRLFFIIAAILTGGLMILVYILMLIVVPEAPYGMSGRSASPEAAGVAEEEGADSIDPPFMAGTPPGSGFAGGLAGSARFTTPSSYDRIHHRRHGAGWALVALGALVLLANLNLLSWLNLHVTWPVFLILAGVLLILRQRSPR